MKLNLEFGPQGLMTLLADALPIERFGGRGDGVTDDAGAFAAALASARPIRLGPRAYLLSSLAVTQSAILLGTPGATRIIRPAGGGAAAWINWIGVSLLLDGILFDATAAGFATGYSVLVAASVQTLRVERCGFVGAAGPLGHGLTVRGLPAPGAQPRCDVLGCDFLHNAQDGLLLWQVSNGVVERNWAQANGGNGIEINSTGATSATEATRLLISANRCGLNTGDGISLGNYNQGTVAAPVWGPAAPQVALADIAGNICWDNGRYQIQAANDLVAVHDNQLSCDGTITAAGGICANLRAGTVRDNLLSVPGVAEAIDVGGSQDVLVAGNKVAGGAVGINCGGGQNIVVSANTLTAQTAAGVQVLSVEDDGAGRAFPFASSQVVVRGNAITLGSGVVGVLARDNPAGLVVEGNDFWGGDPSKCIDAYGLPLIRANRFNGSDRLDLEPVAGVLVVPDGTETARVLNAAAAINQVITPGMQAAGTGICWLTLTNPGTGYTEATVTIADPTGAGAAYSARIWGGQVIGFRFAALGGGYTAPSVTITGDGTGATATAQVGLPLATARRLGLLLAASATLSPSAAPGGLALGAFAMSLAGPVLLALAECNGCWAPAAGGSGGAAQGQQIALGGAWIEQDANGMVVIGVGTTRLLSVDPSGNLVLKGDVAYEGAP
jgi:hypothetical protein